MKRCPGCGEDKPTRDYSVRRHSRDGLAIYCRDCIRRRNARYRAANRDRINARKHAEELRRLYGMTEEEYMKMFEAQGGNCALCGQPEKVIRNGRPMWLAVDHNHRTGGLRKLLCYSCNRSRVGLYEAGRSERPEAAAYVGAH